MMSYDKPIAPGLENLEIWRQTISLIGSANPGVKL